MELGRKIKSGARTVIEQAIIDGTNREGFLPLHEVEQVVNRTLLNDVLKAWGYQDEYKGSPFLCGWTYVKTQSYAERPDADISATAITGKRPEVSTSQKFKNDLLSGMEVVIDDVPLCRAYVSRLVKQVEKNGFDVTTTYCDVSNRSKAVSYKLTEQSAANMPF